MMKLVPVQIPNKEYLKPQDMLAIHLANCGAVETDMNKQYNINIELNMDKNIVIIKSPEEEDLKSLSTVILNGALYLARNVDDVEQIEISKIHQIDAMNALIQAGLVQVVDDSKQVIEDAEIIEDSPSE